jgi:hypothetical protein
MPNATQQTVYNFIHGQYATFTQESFDKAIELYPIADYNNSFDLQGQQMYGEMRYICTASMITAGARRFTDSYNYQFVLFLLNNICANPCQIRQSPPWIVPRL